MHQLMAQTVEDAVNEIQAIQQHARNTGDVTRQRWPLIILRTPKGWTGPKEVDGKKTEDSWRSHQVPFSDMATNKKHLKLLEDWLKSYKPQELFDEQGHLHAQLAALAPKGDRRM